MRVVTKHVLSSTQRNIYHLIYQPQGGGNVFTGVCLSTVGLMATRTLLGLVTARSVRILLECFLIEGKSWFVHGMEGEREREVRKVYFTHVHSMLQQNDLSTQTILSRCFIRKEKKTYCKIILFEIKICKLYNTWIRVLF